MSLPRCVLPGVTYLLTRRVTRRYFLLRPDADGTTQQIYWYATGVMIAKYGIALHAVQMLSTHLHEVLTDVRGVMPAFKRDRNRLVSNALKVHLDWPEEVFQRAQGSCVELHGPGAVLKEIGYTLANVVEAGLVEHPDEWPGVTISVNDIGERVIEVERPSVYFDPKNPNWPDRIQIPITMPPALTEAYGANAKAVLVKYVREAIEQARKSALRAGRFVKTSAAKLCSVPITQQSSGDESFGSRNPTFATAGDAEAARSARAARKRFLDLYRRALDELKQGIAGVSFPEGTWRWAQELLPAWLLGTKPTTAEIAPEPGEGQRAAATQVQRKPATTHDCSRVSGRAFRPSRSHGTGERSRPAALSEEVAGRCRSWSSLIRQWSTSPSQRLVPGTVSLFR